MKTRSGWVSNSSSTSFIINNKSDADKTVVDFVKEIGMEVLKEYVDEYNFVPFNNLEEAHLQMIQDAEKYYDSDKDHYTIPKNGKKDWVFGDETGDMLGEIFDYGLRNSLVVNDNFTWYLNEYLR